MAYTSYDFTESLDRVGIALSSVVSVLAAWGRSRESCGDWEGGFLVHLADGRFAYLSGWCDTSGWGCQDAAEVMFFQGQPDLAMLPAVADVTPPSTVDDWDVQPADLNRSLAAV